MKSADQEGGYLVLQEGTLLSAEAISQAIKATLAKKADLRFKVSGFSMLPFIRPKDIVTISPLANSTIGVGRVVVFLHPRTRKIAIHRIIKKSKGDYFLKGDGVSYIDPPVERADILGVVTQVERENKKVRFAKGVEGFLVAFLSRRNLLSYALWRYRNIFSRIRIVQHA